MSIGYKQLSSKVEYCLKTDEQSRNSDIRLYNNLLLSFPSYKKYLLEQGGSYYIPLMARYNLPKEEDVCRVRRKLNSQGLYLPTDPEIIKQRKIKQKEWYEEMAPSNPARG